MSLRQPTVHRPAARCPGGRRAPRSQSGFTLVEMMLAVGVFMVGMAGIVTMQLAARHGRVGANDVSLATNLATSTLDALETQNFDDLVSTTTWYDRQGVQLAGADGAFFTVATTVTQDTTAPASGDVKNASAVVSWSIDAFPHSVTLHSKVTR